ncbi:MAG TPA: glycosyltransferase family A protein, partial [Balneolaceae bacterium]|nr:glycosyltransferase family A protein [Balneolaceae bacterium]
MEKVTVLIPTYNRSDALAVTLTCLCFQSFKEFDVVVSDQSDEAAEQQPAVAAAIRVLEHHGHKVKFIRNLPRLGMAQQRQCLLDKAAGEYVLFLDDDVLLEPWALKTMVKVIQEEQCGITGMFVIGLSYKDDV